MTAVASYRTLLLKSLGKKSYDEATKSFDVLGGTAVIDAEPKVAKKVADALMRSNPRISTVLRKGGAVSGEFRTRKYYYVKGRRSFVVEHRENGCVFRFDIRKTYFSPRLSFERARIAAMAKDGETVVDMFAGVGPYAIEIAKSHKASRVVAIELNRDAYESMVENIRLNKAGNVTPLCGDAKKLVAKYSRSADRIIMHLPKSGPEFLEAAEGMARKGCVVHYYAFGSIDGAFEENEKVLRDFFRKKKRRIRVLSERQVRPYSASEIEVVIDFAVG